MIQDFFRYNLVWLSEDDFNEEARKYGESGWELMYVRPRPADLVAAGNSGMTPAPGFLCIFKKRGA